MLFNKKKFQGERMDTINTNSTNFILSINRYHFVKKFLKKTDIALDISCGTGYGTSCLSKYVNKIVGVDIDKKTIDRCKKEYTEKNLSFDCISKKGIKNSKYRKYFDSVISIETIEHVSDRNRFLTDLRYYSKQNVNSRIFITTPNNYLKINPPKNKYHLYEYGILELYYILKKEFPDFNIKIFGQLPTNHKSNMTVTNKSRLKQLIFSAINFIWSIDYKYFQLHRYFENSYFYKKIGSIQRDRGDDFSIYRINPQKVFYEPMTSIFILTKQ